MVFQSPTFLVENLGDDSTFLGRGSACKAEKQNATDRVLLTEDHVPEVFVARDQHTVLRDRTVEDVPVGDAGVVFEDGIDVVSALPQVVDNREVDTFIDE